MQKPFKIALALLLAVLMFLSVGCETPRISLCAPTERPVDERALTVTFFDVGQAESVLVTCGGESMLVDGGSADNGAMLSRALTDRGIASLTVAAVTHGHVDHVGGLPAILQEHPAELLFIGSDTSDNAVYTAFLEDFGAEAIPVRRGDSWSLGQATVRVLWPTAFSDGGNNDSLVLLITFGSVSFLLTGDIEQAAESALCEWEDDLTVTVLDVPHHGSDTSSSYRFLRETLPKIAVCSVGKNNNYGHPAEAVLSRYAQVPATLFRTDLDGTVVCTVVSQDGRDVLTVRGGNRSIVVR